MEFRFSLSLLPTFSHFLIVNKIPLPLSPRALLLALSVARSLALSRARSRSRSLSRSLSLEGEIKEEAEGGKWRETHLY